MNTSLQRVAAVALALIIALVVGTRACAAPGIRVAGPAPNDDFLAPGSPQELRLGSRPLLLAQGLDHSALRDRLLACKNGPFRRTDFSIAHRGAPRFFPEHSDVSYRAAARMGAGIVECDVTFTKDGALVCRHSECDLHTTTNIVATKLNGKCTVPWTGPGQNPEPQCCTSDLTLEEFLSLEAKADTADPEATTPEGYLAGAAVRRADLYPGRAGVLTFRQSIALNEELSVKHTPELKGATHPERMAKIFGSQEAYARAFVDELKDAGVNPANVWPQSFDKEDVLYWIQHSPAFGKQAIYLDGIDPNADPPIDRLSKSELEELKDQGLRIFAPPMWALLAVSGDRIVPSEYAKDIREAGLQIITWAFERSDLRNGASRAGWYYRFDPLGRAVRKESDMYKALDVLAREAGIVGIFSDWPATVTYYANCTGLP
jgi:glycerophosphoryl diester phosphodiesterase